MSAASNYIAPYPGVRLASAIYLRRAEAIATPGPAGSKEASSALQFRHPSRYMDDSSLHDHCHEYNKVANLP
jgi:hypothetical protein